MIVEEEIWSRIDAIGREVVEEQKSMTNDEFAIAISSYCIGCLYAYCSITQADSLVKHTRKKAINSMMDNLDIDDIAQS